MSKKVLFIVLSLCLLAVTAVAGDKFTLVIDAGHGGHDSGALGASSKEKNINLKVALAFGRLVEKNCPDVRVVYTRKTDVFIPLSERAAIANRNKADLFISIHTNAVDGKKQVRGFEVYTLGMHRAGDNLDVAKRENSVILVESDYKKRYQGFDPKQSESYIMFEFMQDKYMAKSVELAQLIQRSVCAVAERPNKGVHQAGFLVLRETSMPSCLIELGFITTPDEERLLNSERGVDAHARGIYNAFVKYKNKYGKGQSAPFVETAAAEPAVPAAGNKEEEARDVHDESVAQIPQPSEGGVEVVEHAASVPAPAPAAEDLPPVFKIQVLSSLQPIAEGSAEFRGLHDVEAFSEGGLVKYTWGASADYNEIYRLRKTILPKFPNAFIVAFRGAERMDVVAAIREYRRPDSARSADGQVAEGASNP